MTAAARIGKRGAKVAPAVTDWFGASTPPTRIGPYERLFGFRSHSVFQNWNGEWWGCYAHSPEDATRPVNADDRSQHQDGQWRGLAADPAKAGK